MRHNLSAFSTLSPSILLVCTQIISEPYNHSPYQKQKPVLILPYTRKTPGLHPYIISYHIFIIHIYTKRTYKLALSVINLMAALLMAITFLSTT